MRKKTSRSPGKGSGFRKLFRTENPVAGVAQAGNDVLMLIELFVHRRRYKSVRQDELPAKRQDLQALQ